MRYAGTVIRESWAASRPLGIVSLLMLAALAASVVGLWMDPRVIGGAPAWLKPAKFAASTAIYAMTLAWIFTFLPAWPRVRRFVGWTTAIVFVLEVVLIDVQAWRGTTSHFNVGTVLDAVLFSIMGAAIFFQTFSSVLVAIALWRQPFADAALGWTLRLGFALTIIGALSGGLMTSPTSAQIEEARTTHRMTIAGAHTVGAPDGGAGVPGTGWSTSHGDLRVPHFLGLHAIQVLPLLLFVARGIRDTRHRVRLAFAMAGSYASLFAILMWQALRGQSIVQPDTIALVVFVVWGLLTGVALSANSALPRRAAVPR